MCVFVYAHVCECLRVDECPVPLVRVWLIHETEFVCGMPARHSCCMQIRGWKWICKSEIKTARGHDYNEHSKGKMKVKQTKKIIIINTAKPSSTAGKWLETVTDTAGPSDLVGELRGVFCSINGEPRAIEQVRAFAVNSCVQRTRNYSPHSVCVPVCVLSAFITTSKWRLTICGQHLNVTIEYEKYNLDATDASAYRPWVSVMVVVCE